MSLNWPSPGGLNSAEFQVSPVPWVTSSQATGVVEVAFRDNLLSGTAADMTYVSNWIRVVNKGGTSLGVAFTRNGFSTGNSFLLAANETFQANLRLTTLYLSGSATSYNVVAGLTGIQARQLPVLTASNGFPGVG